MLASASASRAELRSARVVNVNDFLMCFDECYHDGDSVAFDDFDSFCDFDNLAVPTIMMRSRFSDAFDGYAFNDFDHFGDSGDFGSFDDSTIPMVDTPYA